MSHTATYSLADDKLRLYPDGRLDAETYARVKALGLSWAPKQEWFGQVWTPAREDLLLELAGDIDDEDVTPQERAAARAERFEGYSDHAAERATSAQAAAERIMNGIPLGQPILVGHHSQRHAERDAEKIQNGIRRAVDEMKATAYWADRARGVLHHADYKERPDVVARRIKTLETDERKHAKERKEAITLLAAWRKVEDAETLGLAMKLAEYSHTSRCYTLAEFPRDHDTYEGKMSVWGALDHGIITVAQARDQVIPDYESTIVWHDRWLEHLGNRLAYERELLAAAGGLAADQKPLEVGGAVVYMDCWLEIIRLNRSGGVVTSVSTNPHPRFSWAKREVIEVSRIKTFMTKAEYEAAGRPAQYVKPGPVDETLRYTVQEQPWEALEQAANSVTAVSAPELFPTPSAVIEQMLDLVDFGNLPASPWKDGRHRVDFLEPEAGTGAIIRATLTRWTNLALNVECCELNRALADGLLRAGYKVVPDGLNEDFLEYKPGPFYGLILANPPFSREIEHVRHMYECLAPGGQMVTVMSEGPFFRERDAGFRSWLVEVGGTSELLPEGSFQPATGVNTRLVVIRKAV